MWLKKIKKKKFQFLLVLLMLCFTTVIFAACISFVAETSAYTDDFVSYRNCPKVISLSKDEYEPGYFEQYPELMEKTGRIAKCDATITRSSFWFGGTQLKTFINVFYHVDELDGFMHSLKLMEGKGISPAYGEIWINSVTADTYGIHIGDTIQFGSPEGRGFRVGGVVATLICPSPYMGILPYYINEDTAELLGGDSYKGYSLYSKAEMPALEYKNLLPDEFIVTATAMVDADGVKTSISYLATIFGGVGILAAAIVFAVSLVIIRFIIVSSLAKEYVEIGTYKALGFTESQITGFYLKSFAAAGITGIVLGGALSLPLSHYLCSMVLRHIGSFRLTWLSAATTAGVLLLLSLMLVAGVLISLRRIRKVTPVEAFSINSLSSKKKAGKSFIKNAYLPLSVAVNDIVRKKKASLITLAVLTVSFYMSSLFLSVNYSLQRMDEMTGQWFTFPKYTGIVNVSGRNEELEHFLESSELLSYYLYSNIDVDMSGIRSRYDINMNELYTELYNDCSEKALGLPLVEGRHPEAPDEILMSYDLAKRIGLSTGEWFSVENDSYANDYLITGLFSSMYNGGLNILMDGEEFARFGKPDKYNSMLLFAREGISYKMLENEIKEAFPDINISQTEAFLEGSITSLNNISQPLTTIFAVIFSLFSLLNIVNLLIMNNIENRKQYGVLKAMGFTNSYICIRNLLRIGLLATVSAALSLLLHVLLSQRIFFGIIHVNGLISNPGLTAAVTGVLFMVIMLATAMFTLPLKRIAPTDLMEE